MKHYITAQNHAQVGIEEVQKRFEDWRRDRIKRSFIPESLWDAAVKLYPQYTPYEISKALKLHYGKLKSRILNACQTKTSPTIAEKKDFKEKKRDLTPAKKIAPKAEKKKDSSVYRTTQSQTVEAINQSSAFIKLEIPGQQTVDKEWSIEIENVDGSKMKISGKSIEIPDLISICQNFSRGRQ